jgi:His-Xaa-Ser system protein HxsD
MVKQETKNEIKQIERFANIKIIEKQGNVVSIIDIDATTFPLKVILAAVYTSIEKAGFIVDKKNKSYVIEIMKTSAKPKELLQLSKEFQNRLIDHAFYELQTMRTAPLNDLLLHAVDFPYDYAEQSLKEEETEQELKHIPDEVDEKELEEAFGVEELEIPWSEEEKNEGGEKR